jgi:hypothetical protein
MPSRLPVRESGEGQRGQRCRRHAQCGYQPGDMTVVRERRGLHPADRFGVGFPLGADLNLFWHSSDRRWRILRRASQ